MFQRFQGFIKDVSYRPQLLDELERYRFEDFNINTAKSSGIITTQFGEVAFSKWVSPKRTRSYPFERIYKTYGSQKIITIIPILKDEGANGELDYIGFTTFSWMNLLNVYVILAYYDDAKRGGTLSKPEKITKQAFNSDFVNLQIDEILSYKQSALHWNRSLIEERFTSILKLSFDAYIRISSKTGVKMNSHSKERLTRSLSEFEEFSMKASSKAADREILVNHASEYTKGDDKSIIEIKNYLGGRYILTADRVYLCGKVWIIQESKNSTKGFPSLPDIKDGLFKLILFSNLDTLKLNGVEVDFKSRLHLTGYGIIGSLLIPCTDIAYKNFITLNKLKSRIAKIIDNLRLENRSNPKIEIFIEGNT